MVTIFVARKLKHKGLGFRQVDNAFVKLADPQQARASPTALPNFPGRKILRGFMRDVSIPS